MSRSLPSLWGEKTEEGMAEQHHSTLNAGGKNRHEKDLPSPRKYEFNATEAWLEHSRKKEGVGSKHKGCKD